ncbi:MAG TPA: HYR domain-containing protein [Chitinophagaceae bacterium]|jgi:hypothetical protein|nr:HYR domain-containing protein [Chitinophagaceae bacterium]
MRKLPDSLLHKQGRKGLTIVRKALIFLAAATLLYSCFPGQKSTREENEENEKYDGPMAREQYEFDRTVDPALGYVPYERLKTAMDQTIQLKSMARTYPALTWIERGPIYDSVGPSNGNGRGGGTGSTLGGYTSGRIRAFLLDTLNDPTGNTAFAGGVCGGVWRCTNFLSAGPNWVNIDDNFSNIAIGSICQYAGNPSIIYVATGEAASNADAAYGNGVYKSTDGGLTFQHLPSTINFKRNFKIACDPAGNIYLATRITTLPVVQNQGMFRSTDGGTTWVDITPGDLTSVNNTCTDFEFTASGILNATFGYATGIANTIVNHRYTSSPATVTPASWSSSTGFRVTPGAMRTEMAVTGNTLYAVTINTAYNTDSCYRSTNGGVTWTKQNVVSLPAGLGNAQGWYSISLAINPLNTNELISGGLDAYRSVNGGTTWTRFTNWISTLPYVHADHHYAQYWIKNGETRMIMACDGGIFYSTNNGSTFVDKNKNLAIKQFYAGAIHPAAGSDYLIAGAQDNGTHQLKYPGLNYSIEVTGGDGCFVHINQVNPLVQYGSYVYNQYRRTTNGGNTWQSVNFSGSVGLFVNPFDSDDAQNIMYCSNGPLSQIRRWVNSHNSSTNTSIQFATATLGTATVSLTALKVSPYAANRVFFGTNNGRIFRLDNANTVTNATIDANTTNISSASFPAGTVSCVNTGTDDNNIIAVWSNYGISNVWVTTNGGTSWTAIEGNLPDMPVRWAMFEPGDNNKIYLATEVGLYTTTAINGASTFWLPDPGFPLVKTNTLRMRTSDSTIVAATHGRGLWTAKIPPCVTSNITAQPANTVVCPGQTATFTVGAAGGLLAYQWQVSTDNGITYNDIPGATSATLNVPAVTPAMNGYRYRNNVDTYCSGLLTSGGAILTVGSTPSFTSCPANITVSNAPGLCGATVTYPAAIANGTPAPTVVYSQASGTFFPKGTTTVTATATNACGTQTCTFTVTVNDVEVPTVTCPANITVTSPVGSCSAVVNYLVTGADNCPGVTTTRSSGPASGSSFPVGITTITYFATDAGGLVSVPCSFTITVIDAQLPVISSQPVNRTVCVGSNATFSVVSTNVGTYQWQAYNGTTWNNIPGANGASYTVNNVTQSMNTNPYRVIINGLCTPVTSNHAVLYVNPLPTVSLSASRAPALLPMQLLNITAVVSPTGGSYVWYKNGVVIAGATSVALTGLTVDDAGVYKVVYTDPNGCVNTSADMVVSVLRSSGFYVYPNPNNGQFLVRYYNEPGEKATVRVFDAKGARIYEKAFTTSLAYSPISIQLPTTLQDGGYIVEVINAAGKRIGSKRILVQKN